MITMKWPAEPQLGERRLEPLVELAPTITNFTKLVLWLLRHSAAKPQPKERGLQSAGRLINEQAWGIVQRVLSELTFRRNKFRAPKIVAVRDDFGR